MIQKKLFFCILITKITILKSSQEISEETQISNIIKQQLKTITKTNEENTIKVNSDTKEKLVPNNNPNVRSISYEDSHETTLHEESSEEQNLEFEEKKEEYNKLKELKENYENQYKLKRKKDVPKNLALKFIYNRVNFGLVMDLENLCLKNIDYKLCMEFSQYLCQVLGKIHYKVLMERTDYVGVIIKLNTLKLHKFWGIYDLIKDSNEFFDSTSDGIMKILEFKNYFNDKVY